jgi:hypothetical protein
MEHLFTTSGTHLGRISSIVSSLLLAFTLAQNSGRAQEGGPGPEHEELKKMEGTWTAKVKAGDSESAATMTCKMECGGLWLVSDFRGKHEGQPFQGRGLDGYDPKKKKYVSVWVDSMTPRPLLFEGTYDKEKKTLTMTGEGLGYDGKPARYKSVAHMPDDDHHTFTMYMVGPDGRENKMMTIEYTRKK